MASSRVPAMFHSYLHLKRVVHDAFCHFGGGRKRFQPDVGSIEVRFYPYAGLHHTIRIRAGRVYVRISDLLESAPPEVIRALAFLLVARLLSRKAPRNHERVYRSYAFKPDLLRASDLARRQRGRKIVSTSTGRVYDLARMFTRLSGALKQKRNRAATRTFTEIGRWAPPESGQAAPVIARLQAKLARSVLSRAGLSLDNDAALPLDYVVCNTSAVPFCDRSSRSDRSSRNRE